MSERRRDLALAIKACLDSLHEDAVEQDLTDLAHFIGLASLAAVDAAEACDTRPDMMKLLLTADGAGHC